MVNLKVQSEAIEGIIDGKTKICYLAWKQTKMKSLLACVMACPDWQSGYGRLETELSSFFQNFFLRFLHFLEFG